MSGVQHLGIHTFGMHLKHFGYKRAKLNSDAQESWRHLTYLKAVTCKPSVFLSCSLTTRQAQGELFSSSAWNVQSLIQSGLFSPQGAAFPPLQQELASAGRSWAAASCVQTKQLAGGLGEPPSCLGNSYITVLWHIGFLSLSSYYFSATYFFLHQKRLFPPHTSWERIRINGWWGREDSREMPVIPWQGQEESFWILFPQPATFVWMQQSIRHVFFLFFFAVSILCSFRKFGQERLQSHIKNITVEKIKMEYCFINR